jgi:hypothetical protein
MCMQCMHGTKAKLLRQRCGRRVLWIPCKQRHAGALDHDAHPKKAKKHNELLCEEYYAEYNASTYTSSGAETRGPILPHGLGRPGHQTARVTRVLQLPVLPGSSKQPLCMCGKPCTFCQQAIRTCDADAVFNAVQFSWPTKWVLLLAAVPRVARIKTWTYKFEHNIGVHSYIPIDPKQCSTTPLCSVCASSHINKE